VLFIDIFSLNWEVWGPWTSWNGVISSTMSVNWDDENLDSSALCLVLILSLLVTDAFECPLLLSTQLFLVEIISYFLLLTVLLILFLVEFWYLPNFFRDDLLLLEFLRLFFFLDGSDDLISQSKYQNHYTYQLQSLAGRCHYIDQMTTKILTIDQCSSQVQYCHQFSFY